MLAVFEAENRELSEDALFSYCFFGIRFALYRVRMA